MAKFGNVRRLMILLGGAFLLPLACSGEERDFAPAASGGSGGKAGKGGGGQATGGEGEEGGSGAATSTAGDNAGGGPTMCTDTLPSGDECGGTCDPCPDGLACNEGTDCSGGVCMTTNECCTPAAEEDACAGFCGTVLNCEVEVTCSDCVGEAMCNADNLCECPTRPCALASASYGDANVQQVRGLALDTEGNAYVVGDFKGTLTFGEDILTSDGVTWSDVYLVKFLPDGTPDWAQKFGDSSDQQARGVAVDGADNVVIIGTRSGTVNFGGSDLIAGDMFIAKFDSAGVHQFSDAYGADNTQPKAVACDPATGEIVVTGWFYGTLQFGSLSSMASADQAQAYFDLFTVRFSATGMPGYSKRFGAGFDEFGESVAVSGSYAYFAGTFRGDLDFGSPNPTPLTATGYSDLFVAKLGKNSFSHGWSKRFGNAGADYAVDTARLVVDPLTGDVIVGGNFTGTMEFTPELSTAGYEMFLARLEDATNGTSVWATQIAGAEIRAMALGADGYVYVTGSASGDVDFGGGTISASATDDVFLAKYDLDGNHVYSRVFTSPTGNQYGEGVDATASGTAWIAVRFDGQLELGMDPLQTQGGFDIAIGKYAP
jgi:hypothetical protein